MASAEKSQGLWVHKTIWGDLSMGTVYGLFLLLAIVLEVTGTTCMKLSCGFTRIVPTVLMGIFYMMSISSLTMALKRIEIGVAYAIWSGLGTALIAVIGFVGFHDALTPLKAISIVLIIAGVVGLNLAGGLH
jgi:small multidrug resistance pump